MAFTPQFYQCAICGQVMSLLKDQGVPVECCGQPMDELTPNTTEASTEKHLPVARRDGDKIHIKVGGAAHPMLPEHHIEWIYLLQENGGQRRALDVGKPAEASFNVEYGAPKAVYEYCNLHGLWKTDL